MLTRHSLVVTGSSPALGHTWNAEMASVSEDPKPSGTTAQEVKQDNGGNEGKTNSINYVPPSLTDEEYRSIFSPTGPIKASKIVRHKATDRGYGFGLIDYRDAGDAKCAIESLNGLQMLGKTIKVLYAMPGGERIRGAKLYIRGIPKDYPLEQAEKVFANFGKLIQFRVIENKSGTDRRLAFVLYDFRDNAEAVTGTKLPGATEPLVTKNAHPNLTKRKQSRGSGAPHQLTSAPHGVSGRGSKPQFRGWNRYKSPRRYHYSMVHMTPATAVTCVHMMLVYDIGTDMDESSLWRLVANYGNVTNVSIVRDTATGQSTGYGLATMAFLHDCVSVIERLNLVPLG